MLERAATVAALAITKEQAVAAVEGKYRAEFLRDALAGRAGEPADAVSHAASLGWDLAAPGGRRRRRDRRERRPRRRRAPGRGALAPGALRPGLGAGGAGARHRPCRWPGFSQEVVAMLPADPGRRRRMP